MNEMELYHHGIKGQKHGENRYQTKDGEWTPLGLKRRREREGFGEGGNREGMIAKRRRLRAEKKEMKRAKKRASEVEKEEKKIEKKIETIEEKRARLLKSSNAEELYKNRDLLTTAEINERLNRIDVEQKLAKVANSTKKSGMDRIQKVIDYGKKINEAYDAVAGGRIGKDLLKKLGFKIAGDSTSKPDRKLSNLSKMSDKEVKEWLNRLNDESNIKKNLGVKDKEKSESFSYKDFLDNISKKSDSDVRNTLQRAKNEKSLKDLAKALSSPDTPKDTSSSEPKPKSENKSSKPEDYGFSFANKSAFTTGSYYVSNLLNQTTKSTEYTLSARESYAKGKYYVTNIIKGINR